MGTINDKLTYLDGTKTAIRNVLNEQGIDITTEDTFRSYAQKIGNEFDDLNDVIENLPTSTVQGTTINVDDCLGGRNPITIKGNTYQASYEGKNLLPNTTISGTVNGLSVTVNDDKSIKISGTSTTNTYINLTTDFKVLPGTYTLSGCPVGGGQDTYRLQLFYSGYSRFDNGSGDTFTLTTERTYTSARINIPSGVTVNNIIFKPQLEQGSTATDYEPYVGGVPSPNPDYPQDIHVVTGENIIKTGVFNDGEFLLGAYDNLNNKSRARYTNSIIPIGTKITIQVGLDLTKYKWSVYESTSELPVQSQISVGAGWLTNTNSFTYTTGHQYVNLNIAKLDNTNFSDDELLQFSAIFYADYHAEYPLNLGSIELCKIGNYQDYIYKENGNWYKYGIIRKYTTPISSTLLENGRCRVVLKNRSSLHDMSSSTNVYAESKSKHAIVTQSTGNTTSTRYNYGWGGLTVLYSVGDSTKIKEIGNIETIYDLRDWFIANEIIYAVIDPTYDYIDITQITDETLIAQLDALDKAKWNKGANIITTTVESPNAVPELQATYKRYPKYQDKDVTATSNGTTTIQKDEEYDAINSINLNVAVPPNWTEIGYEDTPPTIIDGFNYAKQVQANWNPDATSLNGKFNKDTNLLVLPLVDTSKATNFANFCADARHLIYIPLIDTSKATTLQNAFTGVSIAEFPNINTSSCTNFSGAFSNNKALKHFKTINTSKGENFNSMFKDSEQLQYVDILDLSSATNLQNMFLNCNQLTDYSLNNIMQMCIEATAYTGTKTLKNLGLNSSRATRATQLENYQAFLDAGWTTGY